VYCEDGSSKSLVADAGCSIFWLRQQLVAKCRAAPSLAWTLVEQRPAQHLERELEEDETIADILADQTGTNNYRLLFSSRPGRLDLFRRPEKYLGTVGGFAVNTRRSLLLKHFFVDSTDSALSIKGPLWLKVEGKKGWRKFVFILRSTGIYYWPKERRSFRKSPAPPACLVSLSVNPPVRYYLGLDWRQKHKAPTEFGFAISQEQVSISGQPRLIHLCAETEESRREWQTGLRVAQNKERVWANFNRLLVDLKERSRSPPVPGNWWNGPATRASSSSFLAATSGVTGQGSAINTPSSESKSWDSGVCSNSEVRAQSSC